MAGYARGRDAVKLGALATIAAIGFSVLFMQMTSRGLSLTQWDVHVRIPSADGLRKRDPVFFRGVAIGEVRSLVFTDAGDVVVRAHLKERVPLTRAAHAELVALDLFGRQSLVLREGPGTAAPLRDGDTIAAALPVSMTGRMIELGDRAERMISDTTVLLLQGALAGAGAAGQHVAALSARLDTLLLAQQYALGSVLHETAGLARNLNAATDPQGIADLREELTRAVAGLARLSARLDSTTLVAGSVLGSLQEGQGSAGRLLHDPELYVRTTELLASVDALVRDLKQNPKKYVNVSVF
ncbi:MAG TPA: MlaD family protein [Longimicrobiales bacterium]|nr:MlaD family protein [Longimicrobiales bacterium]